MQHITIPEVYDFGMKLTRKELKYRVVAIIAHSGPNIESGHYICYAKRQVKKEIHWFKLNDSEATQVPFELI
jgi:uncharacterized UBP type Zn finger protein